MKTRLLTKLGLAVIGTCLLGAGVTLFLSDSMRSKSVWAQQVSPIASSSPVSARDVQYFSGSGPHPVTPTQDMLMCCEQTGTRHVKDQPTVSRSAYLSSSALVLVTDFKGIDARVPVGWPAPDPDIAAGPTNVVLVTNDLIAIYTKTGALLAQKDLREFFASLIVPGQNGYDPVVVYDPLSQRFFIAATGSGSNTTCTPGNCVSDIFLAVSKNSSPSTFGSSDWYFYDLDVTLNGSTPTANAADAPKVGTSSNTVVLAVRMDRFSDGSSLYEKIRILDKSKLIAGQPVTWTDFWGMNIDGDLHGNFQPALHFDSSANTFFLLAFGGSALTNSCETVWGITNPLISPTLQAVEFPDGGLHCPPHLYAEQKGGGTPLWMGNNGTHFRAAYRNGSLWTTRMLGHDFGSGEVGAIRWFQADVSDWPNSVTRLQDAIFGVDGIDHFYPALMVDESNNLVVVYARSSPNEYASLYFTGRLGTDPPNTLREGILLKAGMANISLFDDGSSINRFGDYFGVALDPTDSSFWVHGEYAKASNQWGTWVGNIIFDIAGVDISGPTRGGSNTAYTFTALVNPITATPITYVWEATGQPPVTHTSGLSDTVTFSWPMPGSQVITVTAMNTVGSVVDTHSITVDNNVYLPLIRK